MQIKRYALAQEETALLATREFLPFAERKYIDRATGRLVKTQFFERLAYGVFRVHRDSNKPVTVQQIAEFKAKSFGRIAVSLGSVLTERVRIKLKIDEQPVEVFATTGHSSSFRFEGKIIYLKGMAKRKIALGETPAGRTMRDLWLLGEKSVDEKLANAVEKELHEHGKHLVNCKPLMPQWLTDRFQKPLINYANRESIRPFQKKLWQLYSPIFKGESQLYFDNSKLDKLLAPPEVGKEEISILDKIDLLKRFASISRSAERQEKEEKLGVEKTEEVLKEEEEEEEQKHEEQKQEEQTENPQDLLEPDFEAHLDSLARGLFDEEKEYWLHQPEIWDDDSISGREPDD